MKAQTKSMMFLEKFFSKNVMDFLFSSLYNYAKILRRDYYEKIFNQAIFTAQLR